MVAGRARRRRPRARAEAARLGALEWRRITCCSGCCSTRRRPGASEALDECGITCDAVRRGASAAAGAGGTDRPSSPRSSPELREVLEHSMREAVARGDARLDVEHLLLAVLHEPGGRGQRAVIAAGPVAAGGRAPARPRAAGVSPR